MTPEAIPVLLSLPGFLVLWLQWRTYKREAQGWGAAPPQGRHPDIDGKCDTTMPPSGMLVACLGTAQILAFPVIVGAVFFYLFGDGDRVKVAVVIAAQTAAVILIFAVLGKAHGISFRSGKTASAPWNPVACCFGALALIVAGAQVTQIAEVVLLEVFGISFGDLQHTVRLIAWNRDDDVFVVLIAMAVGVGAPVSEEIFFRGLFYPLFKHGRGVFRSAVLTGVIFGLVHFNATTFLPLTLLGTYFCFVYEKTGDIRVPMVIHALVNFQTLFMLLCFPEAVLE